MSNNYGTTMYKGEKYEITCEAHVDSDSNGNTVWHSYAIKDGKKYRVTWNTTDQWDKCQELYSLEQQLAQLTDKHYTVYGEEEVIEQLQQDIKELEDAGYVGSFVEDSSGACDWDNAYSVYEVDLD